MAVFFLPLANDTFTRSNVSPLASPWLIDDAADPGLQIVSDACEATSTSAVCGQIYDYASTPNDQYASFKVKALASGGANGRVYVRWTDNGTSIGTSTAPAYWFFVEQFSGNGSWFILNGTSGIIASGSGLTISVGDIFYLAALGTTIYLFQNSTQVASVSNATFSSGMTGLAVSPSGSLTNVQFSGFAMGQASATSPFVSTSTFSPPAGAVSAGTHITVSNVDSALIGFAEYFTTDGSTPTVASTPYSGPITLGTLPETIKVLAVATGYQNSPIASAEYTKRTRAPYVAVFGTSASRFGPRISSGSIFGGESTKSGSGD